MIQDHRHIEGLALALVPEFLSAALETEATLSDSSGPGQGEPDLVVKAGDRVFVAGVKGHFTGPRLLDAWQQANSWGPRVPGSQKVFLLVVPYMTEAAREVASEHGINWIDLSGNAHIRARNLLIHVEGRPNQFVLRGRPSSVFERRSSRLVRLLIIQPGRTWSVTEAAKESGLDAGSVSRIATRLGDEGYVHRSGPRGNFVLREPLKLLEAWREASDFGAHRVLKAHVAARSGTECLKRISDELTNRQLQHAATGLAAAWQFDHFAMFRLTTVYVSKWPSTELLESIGAREQAEGANVWLTLPNDDGVFMGRRQVEGIWCVHPAQAWVDLKDQPERAPEASAHLKESPLLLSAAS